MTNAKIELVKIDTSSPSENVWPDELEALGFETHTDYDEQMVGIAFRIHANGQHSPLRVAFRKSDIPNEDDWLSHGRKLALELLQAAVNSPDLRR